MYSLVNQSRTISKFFFQRRFMNLSEKQPCEKNIVNLILPYNTFGVKIQAGPTYL
jgi:hypothetical protein